MKLLLLAGLAVQSLMLTATQAGDGASAIMVKEIAPGRVRPVRLCWDDGVGRLPVWFVTTSPKLTDEMKKQWDDEKTASLKLDGVIVSVDPKQSAELQTQMFKTEKWTGPNAPTRWITAAAVRVEAEKTAPLGGRTFYIHNLSGTGRSMHLVSELRVLVREAK